MADRALRLTVAIREAVADDLPRVAQIKVASWRDTYAPLVPPEVLMPFLDAELQLEHIRKELARPASLLLVAEAPEVIGFGLTYIEAEPEPWLESLHVARDFRSLGAGAAIVRATSQRLRALGHATMRLGVVAGNDGAMRFYSRLGAVHAGDEPAEWAPVVRHEIYRWSDLSVLG
jgi:ribosomal protein S18 acetylase RimI-like enzyme